MKEAAHFPPNRPNLTSHKPVQGWGKCVRVEVAGKCNLQGFGIPLAQSNPGIETVKTPEGYE